MSERLALLIATLGIKKLDFARRIGFSQPYVSMIVTGKRDKPSERFYDSIHREFGVNIAWLRDGEGEMFSRFEADFSSGDFELLRKYKTLTLAERTAITEIINSMARNYDGECACECDDSETEVETEL